MAKIYNSKIQNNLTNGDECNHANLQALDYNNYTIALYCCKLVKENPF